MEAQSSLEMGSGQAYVFPATLGAASKVQLVSILAFDNHGNLEHQSLCSGRRSNIFQPYATNFCSDFRAELVIDQQARYTCEVCERGLCEI